jgi:hypothetical protein
MEAKTADVVDKSAWGKGPWDDEPDRVEWRVPEYPGLACLMVRGPMGGWCGYVGVQPGHPLHGKSYGDNGVDALQVHGGITYGDACAGHICHVPGPGESDEVWWLGFDCAHAGDTSPGLDATIRSVGGAPYPWRDAVYRDVAYVKSEVAELARQLWETKGAG